MTEQNGRPVAAPDGGAAPNGVAAADADGGAAADGVATADGGADADGGAAVDGVAAADGGAAEPDGRDRILTIPNGISMARLLGVPVFLWLVLVPRSQTGDWWAFGLLVLSSLSDWLDGKIARALNQQSNLGQLLDPAADRLYIVATVIALAVRGIIPWWLVGLLGARELLLACVLAVLRRHGYPPLQVSFIGKGATLCLLYAFPLFLLSSHPAGYAEVAQIVGWAFVIWGSALYWCAALLYVEQARRLLAADRENSENSANSASPARREHSQS